MDLHPIKTKKWQDSLYITFKDEAERESAIQKLDGFVWKKKTLKALVGSPISDKWTSLAYCCQLDESVSFPGGHECFFNFISFFC